MEKMSLFDRGRAIWAEITEMITQNPVATVLLILLLIIGYQLHEEISDLQELCALTGEHDGWTVNPLTARDKIDDICLGHDPDQNEPPENP